MYPEKYLDRIFDFMERIKIPVYLISIGFMYLSYFVVFFGIFNINEKYIRMIQISIYTIICLFLLIRFNPFMKPELKPYDSNIIFTSAILLLSNVVIVEVGLSSKITNVVSMLKNDITYR